MENSRIFLGKLQGKPQRKLEQLHALLLCDAQGSRPALPSSQNCSLRATESQGGCVKMKSPPQLMEYITYNSYNLTLNLFGALCNFRGVRSPYETTIFPWCLGCDNIWISKVLKISLSPKTNGKYTEATLQPPNSNGLLTLSVYFFIVVCKNESFCHRNHFRGLYVAAIRQVTKPLC